MAECMYDEYEPHIRGNKRKWTTGCYLKHQESSKGCNNRSIASVTSTTIRMVGILSSCLLCNTCLDDNSKTIVTVFFYDFPGKKSCPNLSPNQLTLRVPCDTETTLILKD
ncbi:hypothetical protein TNCV_5085181 [Trichonephila clavipes]|uniref:Uncharacterized protein n=1 Tax=Trichonephila clavipes TaxID=2585209 RepID=A0A8X6S6C2_TRICX|nr:hypothetical protein TNCV_5085181 [Trichonephila clavipes]